MCCKANMQERDHGILASSHEVKHFFDISTRSLFIINKPSVKPKKYGTSMFCGSKHLMPTFLLSTLLVLTKC